MTRRVVISWSSGKDSAWTLGRLVAQPDCRVVALLTTLLEPNLDVTMHGVPRALLQAQARAVGLDLIEIAIPDPCSEEQYAAVMAGSLNRLRAVDADAVAFGDLFLEDLRARREEKMAGTGIGTTFPLWGSPTHDLAMEMIHGGLEATIVSVDTTTLDTSFLGRTFDDRLLRDLPDGVDPCGENGEFHTFVHGAPFFDGSIVFRPGEIHEGEGFARLRIEPAL